MAGENSPPEKDRKEGGKRTNRRKTPNTDDNKFDWQKAIRTLAFWILIFVVGWILFHQMNFKEGREVQKSYTQYRQYLDSGQIASAEITERQFKGQLSDGTSILTTLPFIDQQMLAEWDSLKIEYQFKEKTTNWLGYLITSILPWIIIIGIWVYIMRRMQGGGGGQRGLFSFGKSRAKMMVESNLRITFEDVAGCDEAKEELREVIEFLRDPKKFSRLGGRIPKGALLLGPPGTGKTLLARAIAGEAQVPFYSMSGADFVEMFVGVGAARVRDLFEQGKKSAPCIIFIDEIDAVGRQRGAGLGGGHDEREQTLNQLLVEMDGFESNEGVILIAATNRPDVLDPALTRPGRFDRQIVVDRPDVRGREGILKVHARKVPLAPDVRLDVLAKGTPGLSGADLANLVNEAALIAARNNAEKVNMLDFENAKDKVMMGTERRSMLISEDERKQTAYHEAGHVLVAKMTPGADPVHKVTIIPRGRALGVTHYLPMDEKHNYSRTYLKQNLVHLLGGRVAEKIIFNEYSTGAGNDIERATEISRKMVCEWGMSEKMGPVAWGKQNEEVFLGRDLARQHDYSEKTAQEIDLEIHRIIVVSEQRAEKLLRDNIRKLHLLAAALLEREILDGDEIDQILAGKRLKPLPNRLHPEIDLVLQDDDDKSFERLTDRPSEKTGDRGRYHDRDRYSSRERGFDHDRSGDRGEHRPADRSAARTNRVRPSDATPVKPETAEKPETVEKPETKPPETGGGRVRPGVRRSRNTVRPYGIASSRDPENQRPSSRELARLERQENESEPPKADEEGSIKPTRARRATAAPGTARRTQQYSGARRRYTRAKPGEGGEEAKGETPSSSESTAPRRYSEPRVKSENSNSDTNAG